jgi:hypothetical protein
MRYEICGRLIAGSRLLLVISATFLLAAFSRQATSVAKTRARVAECDQKVTFNRADAYRYQYRGNRCEGRCSHTLSSTTSLRLVSFAGVPSGTDISRTAMLEVVLPHNLPRSVGVRVQDISGPVCYRMDATLATGQTALRWPNQVLSFLRLRNDQLGVVARMDDTVTGSGEVLIPVRLQAGGAGNFQPSRYVLILVPDVRITRPRVSMWIKDRRDPVLDSEPLERIAYERGTPIWIRVPTTIASGSFLHVVVNGASEEGEVGMQETIFIP